MSTTMKLRRGGRVHAGEFLASGYARVMAAVDQLQVEGERLASAVSTADGFEVVAIDHLDFSPRCTITRSGAPCDRDARWDTVCSNCSAHVGLTCEPDRLEVLTVLTKRIHNVCGVEGPFRDLVRFIPLGGA